MNFDGYANMQNLIDGWRKRLCFKATPEARELAVDFKKELSRTHKNEASVLVPNCVYRCGCPEFQECPFFRKFLSYCKENEIDISNIQARYDAYNKMVGGLYE